MDRKILQKPEWEKSGLWRLLRRGFRTKPLFEILAPPPPPAKLPSPSRFQRSTQRFVHTNFPLLSGSIRHQQIQELSESDHPLALSDEEKNINRRLVIVSAALGLCVGGSVYPILGLAAVPVILYAIGPIFLRSAYTTFVREKRIGITALDLVFDLTLILTGHFALCALAALLQLVSKKLVLKTEDRSRKSLIRIFGQQHRFAWVRQDGVEVKRPIVDLQSGDVISVSAGETIPVDGVILSGIAGIDQHILTGEAQPVEREVGNRVYASTLVLTGQIDIKLEKAGQDTTVAQIGKALLHTADYKMTMHSRGEAIADRTAGPMLGVGALAFAAGFPAIRVIALMNANFGYNLRILAPIAMLNYLNLISQHGILVKDGRALELLSKVDTVVFDKTGTLTEETPHVGHIHTYNGYPAHQLLMYAAAAEAKQTHPIARAIVQEARTQGLDVPEIHEASYKMGYGLRVITNNRCVHVGSARFMELEGIPIPLSVQESEQACARQGQSLVMVAVNNEIVGALEMRTTVRAEARSIVQGLRDRNIHSIYIISGDQAPPTQELAERLGIDGYFANVLPEDKAALIKGLQAEGRTVCYVGDGINDAIALKQAHVSVSLRGAATMATDTATVVLMNEGLSQLCHLFDVAHQLENNLRRNLAITILPGILSMSGVLFLHFGMLTTILLNQAGLAVGMLNTLSPLLNGIAPLTAQSALSTEQEQANGHNRRARLEGGEDGSNAESLGI